MFFIFRAVVLLDRTNDYMFIILGIKWRLTNLSFFFLDSSKISEVLAK